MGVSSTFQCLQGLAEHDQVALCTAALGETRAELQAAALRLLADPARLDRPDLVVDEFGSLLPGAVEIARQWSAELLTIACSRIGVGAGPGRVPAFRVIAALADERAVETLAAGLADPMGEVRSIAFAGIEQRVRRVAAAHRDRRAGRDAGTPSDDRDAMVWSVFERCVRSYPEHRRQVFLELLPPFGARAVSLVASLLQSEDAAVFAGPLDNVLRFGRARECVDLVLGLAAHDSNAAARVGRQVLRQRADQSFQVALAERMVQLAEENLLSLRDEAWGGALLEAIPELDKDVAVALLQPAMAQAADEIEGQMRIEAFLSHPAADVQIAALDALRQLRCPNGFESVARVLASAAEEVRLAAAHLVVELAPENRAALLTPLLGVSSPEARRIAMREVSQVSLARFLDRFDAMDQHAREIAARALTKIDDHLVERLAEEIGSYDSDRRIKALKVVDLLDAGAALREPLLELLDDDDVRVRATAVRIVELTGSVDGIKVLIDALSDPDRRVRANAIEAFEQLDDPCYLELLVPFLRDRDNRVRANAAKALWNLGWPEARDVLVAMVADPDERMRMSAVWAIQAVRFHGAPELLRTRESAEHDPAVRARIQEVLATWAAQTEEAR